MTNVKTTTIGGGAEYAKVPVRLKVFRESNPRASISTKPTYQPDGSCIFQATILKDGAEQDSARSTGTARYSAKEMDGKKAFEKLETISVGRALSLLGYLADGEIASSEEMEEFEDYQKTKQEEKMEEIREAVDAIETLDGLKEYYQANKGLGKEFDLYVTKRKKELQDTSGGTGE